MNVGDLIKELQKFPELGTVFFQRGDEIVRLDSTHEIWVKAADGNVLSGPYVELGEDEDASGDVDYGVLLYG